MFTFVYRPKSGSRVICINESKACNFIRTVEYVNGSHLVIGGVKLEFLAAQPGQHWRSAARKTAEMIISSYGGIAWDDRGSICLVVPRRAAKAVVMTMATVRRAYTRQQYAHEASASDQAENLTNATSAALVGWTLIPHNNMCSVDWGLPQFSLGEFKGVDEEIVGPISCRKAGEKFSYRIGRIGEDISWTAPWAAIGIPVEDSEEAPAEEPGLLGPGLWAMAPSIDD